MQNAVSKFTTIGFLFLAKVRGALNHQTRREPIEFLFIRLNHNTGSSAAMLSGTQYMLQKNPCTRLPFACILCLHSIEGINKWDSEEPEPASERRLRPARLGSLLQHCGCGEVAMQSFQMTEKQNSQAISRRCLTEPLYIWYSTTYMHNVEEGVKKVQKCWLISTEKHWMGRPWLVTMEETTFHCSADSNHLLPLKKTLRIELKWCMGAYF